MIYVMCFIFIILNFADYYYTNIILKNGGKELNPIIRFFQYKYKNWIIFKSLNTFFVILLILYLSISAYYVAIFCIFVLNIVYLIVVIFNYTQSDE